MSHGEDKIAKVLRRMGIQYQREYSFPDLQGSSGRNLRFDFAVFDKYRRNLLFLLEYQGEQHYFPVEIFGGAKGLERQRKNDALKRQYCMRHNLKLISIPYYDYDKIDESYIKGVMNCR